MSTPPAPLHQGIFTALVTPFGSSGQIDWLTFEKLLDRQSKAKIDGIVVCGTTGEATSLSVQEKLSLVRKARAVVGPSVHIMAGTGGQNTLQSIELSKLAEAAGADSALVVTPPYIKPNLSGMYGHFEAICDAVDIPICLYHVPGRTNQKLGREAFTTLCSIEGIALIKEASADIELLSEISINCSQAIFSGDDATFLPSLAVGAAGCISVTSNLFPQEFKSLQDSFNRGEINKARAIHNALFPIMQGLFGESNPCPLKYCMGREGLIPNQDLRLPLATVSTGTATFLDACLDQVKSSLTALEASEISNG